MSSHHISIISHTDGGQDEMASTCRGCVLCAGMGVGHGVHPVYPWSCLLQTLPHQFWPEHVVDMHAGPEHVIVAMLQAYYACKASFEAQVPGMRQGHQAAPLRCSAGCAQCAVCVWHGMHVLWTSPSRVGLWVSS